MGANSSGTLSAQSVQNPAMHRAVSTSAADLRDSLASTRKTLIFHLIVRKRRRETNRKVACKRARQAQECASYRLTPLFPTCTAAGRPYDLVEGPQIADDRWARERPRSAKRLSFGQSGFRLNLRARKSLAL